MATPALPLNPRRIAATAASLAATPGIGAVVVHRTDDRDELVGVSWSSTAHRSELPDWAGFVPELDAKIADHVLAGHVADYIHMKSVCRPWRTSTVDPRFFPRNWLLVAPASKEKAEDGKHSFM